ncbi:nitrogenase cofactor biosynthesis protein NifB [Telmatobacter bradus]|uniref:nitrogenase cofactor biosynthesis protein NifB n=1 Tax=Telmatobacter bradus TaxID=474953 RepID=UPI003B430E05
MNSVQTGAMAQVSSLKDHPCFNQEARHTHARIHLPVAPRCNMQCNYCNRKYSCVNESRPGVTCAVLSPGQAIEYLRGYTNKLKNLSVVGIAGPGDPMACASETLETLRMAKAEFPHLLLCLASNGLNLLPYVDDLASLGISHVTVTVNAVDPKIGAKFYDWMVVDGLRHTGIDAAEMLWDRQQRSIQAIVQAGVIVKINTIYVPGMNDEHIEQVAQTVSILGATILNIMPLLPTVGTPFAAVPEPDRDQLKNLRAVAVRYLPQMTHCSRCRADAVGMLGEENSRKNMELLQVASRVVIEDVPISPSATIDSECGLPMTISPRLRLTTTAERPYIAVASKDGIRVNQHLGAATTFRIYKPDAQSSQLVDLRNVASEASGPTRWLSMIEILKDCSGILVSGAGAMPRKIFAHHGITVGIVEGLIDEALDATAKGDDLMFMAKQDFHCGPSCSGDKAGCE